MRRSNANPRWLPWFFAVFVLMGLVGTLVFGVVPVLHVWDASGWAPATCEVSSSRVRSHASSDSTTYSVDIQYTYEWNGTRYHGDAYDFQVGSSSGRKAKQRIVDAHPVGAHVPCFVDPDDPSRAVIDRSAGSYLLFGLFPLVFVAVGLAGPLLMRWRSRAPVDDARRAAAAAIPRDAPVALTSASPWVRVAFLAVFALIWDGIVLVMLSLAASEGDVLTWVFASVFVLGGLGVTLGALPYAVLAALNPRPSGVFSGPAVLGVERELLWTLDGDPSRIDELVITLVGEEAATYRRGTDSVTDRRPFLTVELARLGKDADRSGGVLPLVIGPGAPTFDGPNNDISWYLRFEGAIASWPDLDARLPLHVACAPPPVDLAPVAPRTVALTNGVVVTAPVSVPPGTPLGVHVAWDDAAATGELRVTLRWDTAGRGTVDWVREATALVPTRGRAGEATVELAVPRTPISFSGRLITVTYVLEVTPDGGRTDTVPLIVGNDPHEVVL